MNLEEELKLATRAAREAGDYLRKISEVEILSNEGKDIKLVEDKKSEGIILHSLSQTKYPIISEETRTDSGPPEDGVKWIVDPLDGSLNFYRGIPNSVVSIALWEGDSPLIGVIYDFNRDDLYYGTAEMGHHLNNNKMVVSNITEKEKNEKAVICTGFPSNSDYSDKNLGIFVKKLQDFKKVRLLGSAALSLAYVASGKADAYHENGIMFWDVAAGLALVKFAKGKFEINKVNENQYNVFASNGKIEP